MIQQIKKKIYEFSKGDIITRVVPSKPYVSYYGNSEQDRAFIGKPYKFIGIANGCLYMKAKLIEKKKASDEEIPSLLTSFFGEYMSNNMINLALDIWDDGWSYYIDPEMLEDNDSKNETETKDFSKLNKEELQDKLKVALEKESYEEALKIKIELNRFKD
jgi:hypothetical protein